jgi:hypothetical protein
VNQDPLKGMRFVEILQPVCAPVAGELRRSLEQGEHSEAVPTELGHAGCGSVALAEQAVIA